jgi:hypothetical protein
MGQIVYEPAVQQEFVDHPYNPRLDSEAVARLASLEERCGGQSWAADKIYINADTGQRLWLVDEDYYDDRFNDDPVLLSSQPRYFRKADLLPARAEEEIEEPEMIDVRDIPPVDDDASRTSAPANEANAERPGELPRGSIVIKPTGRTTADRTSDKGDRVTD